MSQSAIHHSRLTGPTRPQDRRLAPLANARPPLLPAADQSTVDLVRQFQQVMMRFLLTQETVMHDLLMFLGGQGTGHSSTYDVAQDLGSELNGNGSLSQTAPSLRPTAGSKRANGHVETATDSLVSPMPEVEDEVDRRRQVAPKAEQTSNPVTPPRTEHTARTSPESERSPSVHGSPATRRQGNVKEPVSRQQLTEKLLEVVSERTGYPEEMLSLDVDLEADLGIDSIKRVEIAGTLIRSLDLPAGQSPDIEKLTGSRTLRQVIDNLQPCVSPAGSVSVSGGTVIAGQAGEEADPIPFDRARTGHGIGRFALKLSNSSSPPRLAGLARDGVIVIVDDETGVGLQVADRLGGMGYRVVRVVSRTEDAVGKPGTLLAVSGGEENLSKLIAALHDRHGQAVALLHLAGLRHGTHDIGIDPDRWRARLASDLESLFLMTQALRPDLERAAGHGGAAVLAVTSMGGSFAIDLPEGSVFPGHGGVVGFLKTLAREWPTVRVKAVDVPAASQGSIANWVLTELMTADDAVEVGYRAGQRMVPQLVASPLIARDPQFPLDGESVVLITGGARGITARAALGLAKTAHPRLILVGRTPLPERPEALETAELTDITDLRRATIEQLRRSGQQLTPHSIDERCRQILHGREVRENLEQIRRTGSRVDYLSCDVRDTKTFGELIDELYQVHGRIDGVIHGAGIIEDRLIKDKRLDSFRRVIETKVNSSLALAAKLRPESLRFLVLFSSVTGRFGNRGQGDYAAASEVLNKLAQDLDRRWPGRVISINWGPWLQSGMVSPEVERQFSERGVKLIPPEIGCRMLEEELRFGRKGEVEILIGGVEGMALERDLESVQASRSVTHDIEETSRGGVGGPASFPLLRSTMSHPLRCEGGVEIVRPLDPEVDFYLRDHCLDGHPVLPFAMAMELMAEVAAAGWPELRLVEIGKIRLMRGVTIEQAPRPMRIVARIREERSRGNTNSPDGVVLDATITAPGKDRQIHYQAVVELGREVESHEARDIPRFSDDLAASGDSEPTRMDVEEAYREWLFHGPLFQGITSIDAISPDGMRGTLRTSSPCDCLKGEPPGAWLIDPILVDSAFQMQVLWARLHWDVTLLPAGVQRCHFMGTHRPGSPEARSSDLDGLRSGKQGPTGTIRYELRVRPDSQPPICNADHLFFGHDGRLLGKLTGVEGTGSKALNRLAGSQRSLRLG